MKDSRNPLVRVFDDSSLRTPSATPQNPLFLSSPPRLDLTAAFFYHGRLSLESWMEERWGFLRGVVAERRG